MSPVLSSAAIPPTSPGKRSAVQGADIALSAGTAAPSGSSFSAFEEMGVTVIEAKGQQFDPELHNAVMHEENEEFGENTVSEELVRGYTCKGRVVRYSMVKVAN